MFADLAVRFFKWLLWLAFEVEHRAWLMWQAVKWGWLAYRIMWRWPEMGRAVNTFSWHSARVAASLKPVVRPNGSRMVARVL